VLLQTVGSQGAGEATTNDDDLVRFLVISHALEIPPPPRL
jgi:hypothetical protein